MAMSRWFQVESNQGGAMRISWVIADSAHFDPTVDVATLKNIGPIWGGWQTWRNWETDNVVCHDPASARNLVTRSFHTRCNLHLPVATYQDLDRPAGVKLYQGEFHQLVDHPDDIVSMHLASSNSDIVLLVGFDLHARNLDHDKIAKHKWHNYKNYFREIVVGNPGVQWVVLDHTLEVDKEIKIVSNMQFDTISNVLSQL